VLDDDQYARAYVHTKISDWRPLSDYATLGTAFKGHEGTVNVNGGSIFIGWPQGSTPQQGEAIGMVLDLGGSTVTGGYSLYAKVTRYLEVARMTLASGSAGYLTSFGSTPTLPIIGSGGTSAATIPSWAVSTAYTAGQLVQRNVSGGLATMFQCLRAHTSAAGNIPDLYADPWTDRQAYAVNAIVNQGGLTYQTLTGISTLADSLIAPGTIAAAGKWTDITASAYWAPVVPPISYFVASAATASGLQTIANLSYASLQTYGIAYGSGYGRSTSVRDYLQSHYTGSPVSAAFKATGYFDTLFSFSGAPRFVVVVAYINRFAQAPLANQYGAQFEQVSVYGKPSYSSGPLDSTLRATGSPATAAHFAAALTPAITADQVISDAVSSGGSDLTANTPTAPTTTLSHVVTDGHKTPREMIDSVNAYHGWITRVNENKQLTFKSRPTVPIAQLGKASGYDFTDQAASSGADVYSRIIVEGQDYQGAALRVVRTAAQLASAIQISAAGASTITAAQQAGIKIVDRLSGIALNPINAGIKTTTTVQSTLFAASAIFRAGVTYVLTGTFTYSGATGATYPQGLQITFGRDGYCVPSGRSTLTNTALTVAGTGTNSPTIYGNANGSDVGPFAFQILWTPENDQDWTSGSVLTFSTTNGNSGVGGDTTPSIRIGKNDPTNATAADPAIWIRSSTLAEMRGIRRSYQLQVPGVQTIATLAAIGDAWLFDHFRAQFRGTVQISGPNAARSFTTGDPIHPAALLLQTGELLQLTDRVDPDTGQVGRDARIAAVNYDHDSETANVELDNRRDNLQTFLNRLSIGQ
jgi:hypothetical protein